MGSSAWRASPAKRAARTRSILNGHSANVVRGNMARIIRDAELDALIAEHTVRLVSSSDHRDRATVRVKLRV
jgi:hypothetical protein